MSTRKPKLSELSLFDFPAKELQLITVSTKAANRPAYPRGSGASLADLEQSQPRPAKGRLH